MPGRTGWPARPRTSSSTGSGACTGDRHRAAYSRPPDRPCLARGRRAARKSPQVVVKWPCALHSCGVLDDFEEAKAAAADKKAAARQAEDAEIAQALGLDRGGGGGGGGGDPNAFEQVRAEAMLLLSIGSRLLELSLLFLQLLKSMSSIWELQLQVVGG